MPCQYTISLALVQSAHHVATLCPVSMLPSVPIFIQYHISPVHVYQLKQKLICQCTVSTPPILPKVSRWDSVLTLWAGWMVY